MDEDKIINALLDLSSSVEKMRGEMMTRTDGRNIQNILESHTTIMKNIHEDHTFSIEWIKRLQDTLDKQAEEIRMLKTRFNLA